MKVIRSSSEILALIDSCNNTTTNNVLEVVQPDNNFIKDCVATLPNNSQNSPKKVLKPLGSRRMLKSNINITSRVSEHKPDQYLVKKIDIQPSNNIRNGKSVLF